MGYKKGCGKTCGPDPDQVPISNIELRIFKIFKSSDPVSGRVGS